MKKIFVLMFVLFTLVSCTTQTVSITVTPEPTVTLVVPATTVQDDFDPGDVVVSFYTPGFVDDPEADQETVMSRWVIMGDTRPVKLFFTNGEFIDLPLDGDATQPMEIKFSWFKGGDTWVEKNGIRCELIEQDKGKTLSGFFLLNYDCP